MEHFCFTDTTDAVGVSTGYDIPEIFSDFPPDFISGRTVQIHSTDDLRNMLVGVHIFQCVVILTHRVEELFIFKKFCGFQMCLFSSQFIDLYHCSKHTAEFTCDIHCPHLVELFFWKAGQTVIYPVAHLVEHVFCSFIACKYMTVIKSGHDLVQCIIWSPDFRIFGVNFQKIKLFFRVSTEKSVVVFSGIG